MRPYLISVATLLASLWMGCDGSGPFETDELALTEPRSQALVDSSAYIASGGFSPGYQNGNLQSDEMTLHWSCADPTDFLCYKIFLRQEGSQEHLIAQIDEFETEEWAIPNLQQNTRYDVRIERVDRSGMHEAHRLTLKTPQWLAPENVWVSVLSPAIAEISWEDRSECERNFYLELERLNYDTGLYEAIDTVILPANQISYQANLPIAQDTSYTYRASIQAISPYEVSTVASVSPSFELHFVPVESLGAEQAYDSRLVELTWVENSTLETSIEVDRFVGNQPQESDWVPVAQLPPNATSWADADTTATAVGDVIHYRVRCVNTYLGVRTETDWRSASLTLIAPSAVPPWVYEAWDGESFYRTLAPSEHHVYLYHAYDDLDIDLCPDTNSMNIMADIYSADGQFIGTYNNYGSNQCEYIVDINGHSEYVIDVFDLNGVSGTYFIWMR